MCSPQKQSFLSSPYFTSLFLKFFASTAISDRPANLSHPIPLCLSLLLNLIHSSRIRFSYFLFPIYFLFSKNSFQRKFFVAILLLPVPLFAANGKQPKPRSTDNHLMFFFKTDLAKKRQQALVRFNLQIIITYFSVETFCNIKYGSQLSSFTFKSFLNLIEFKKMSIS